MMWKGKYGRPGSLSILVVMLINCLFADVITQLMLQLFHVPSIPLPISNTQMSNGAINWPDVYALLPGEAIFFGCFWYWMVILIRNRKSPWAGACIYGPIISCFNVIIAGLIVGALHGSPFLVAILALLFLLIMPSFAVALLFTGLFLGAINGALATKWVQLYNKS